MPLQRLATGYADPDRTTRTPSKQSWLTIENLALDLRLFKLAQAVDSQWAAQVRNSTVARISARMPPIPGSHQGKDDSEKGERWTTHSESIGDGSRASGKTSAPVLFVFASGERRSGAQGWLLLPTDKFMGLTDARQLLSAQHVHDATGADLTPHSDELGGILCHPANEARFGA